MEQRMKMMQEQILPPREKQEQILKNVLESGIGAGKGDHRGHARKDKTMDGLYWQGEAGRRKPGAARILVGAAAVAAVAVLCITGLPQRTLAYIKEHIFGSYFANEEMIAEDVKSYVFEDKDKHVRMMIEGLYADGLTGTVLIHYQALDKTGRTFLAMTDFDDLGGQDAAGEDGAKLSMAVEWERPAVDSVGLKELVERTDKNNKYFILHFLASGEEMESPWIIAYCLSDHKRRTGMINMEDHQTEMVSYRLHSEKNIRYQDMQPTELLMSSVSFQLRGKWLGFKDEKTGERVEHIDHALWGVYREDLKIHMKDGKILSAAENAVGREFTEEAGKKEDFRILEGFLSDGESGDMVAEGWKEEDGQYVLAVDPEQVDHLEIKGERYRLEKQKKTIAP